MIRRFFLRLASLFRSGRAEADLAREIKAHLRLLEDKFISQGMSREEARYAARRAFGGVEQVKERQRDARTFRWLAGWPMDLKLGARMLLKTPGLTAVAVAALAVAIGAGAAYLEFTRDLTRPTLPVPDAGRVVGILVWNTERRAPERRVLHDFAVWRDNASAFEQLGAAIHFERHLITLDGRTDEVHGVEISASAFRLFPAAPLYGRTLVDDDERPGAEPAVVIGHDVWQERFDADPNVIGRTVRLGSVVYTIVGVMPQGFGFPINQNLWTPLTIRDAGVKRGEGRAIYMFGRLKDGVSVQAAQAELQGLLNTDLRAQADAGTNSRPALRAEVQPYLDSLLSEDREGLEMLILDAANLVFVMLLAICGANVATLVFARTAMREAEITVRTALGASRARISAQLFAEALVLSGVGAAAGLGAAKWIGLWGKRVWMEGTGQPRPFWWDDAMSLQTILYVAALAVFAALIVGIIPALKATGPQLQGRLREAGAAGSSMKFGGLWIGVIVTQTGITVLFLATMMSLGWAGIRGRYGMDVTYAREHFLTARLEPDASRGGSPRVSAETLHAIVARLKTEPGVAGVTYATAIPGTTWEQFRFEFATPEVAAGARIITDEPWSEGARVGASFFETLGIPLVSGRLFTDAEILGAHNVAIVDETFLRTILRGRNPLGLMVREPAANGGTPGPWHEIVGVVKDATIRKLGKRPDDAVLYRPGAPGAGLSIRLLIRTQGPVSALSHRLQSAALSVDPDLRLADVMSMDRLADAEALPTRFFLRFFAVVGAVALLLSTAGIYALISFTLARRRREIGIRIALGAAPRRIITSVFSRAFVQIGLGVLAGALPGFVVLGSGVDDAAALGRVWGAAGTAAVCAFVVLVALIACLVPLRRALRIEPTEALRAE